MLKINFRAESDWQDYGTAVAEYEKLWQEEGEKIVAAWEKHTGLKFKETEINASVFNGQSHSHPLSLHFDYSADRRRAVLVHELGHRLLYKRVKEMKNSSLHRHQFLYLALVEVLPELYGQEFLAQTIEIDKSFEEKYKLAWDFVLKFTPEERKKKFQEILAGDLSGL